MLFRIPTFLIIFFALLSFRFPEARVPANKPTNASYKSPADSSHKSEAKNISIDSFKIVGANEEEEALVRSIMCPGTVFESLEENIQRLTEVYERRGFPLVEIDVIDMIDDHERIMITLQVKRNHAVVIDSIEFSGISITKQHVLRREVSISQGSRFDGNKIASSMNNLRGLTFIEQVSEPTLVAMRTDSDTDFVKLQIHVTEKATTVFDGLLGYEPKNSAFGLFGNINLTLRNMFGTGREAHAEWRGEQHRQEALVSYSEPWLFGLPIHVNVEGSFDIRDTVFSVFRAKLKATYHAFLFTTISLLAEWEGLNLIGQTKAVAASTSFVFTGIELNIDSRDRRLNSTTGGKLSASYQVGTALGAQSQLVQKILIKGEYYLKIVPMFVIAFDAMSGAVFSSNLQLNNLITLGGVKNLRGYRNDEFWTDKVIMVDIEARLLTSDKTNVFAFYNAAYFTTPYLGTYLLQSEQFKHGFGAGLTFSIGEKKGIIGKLSYAIVDIRQSVGETFLNGKIHVSLMVDL